MRIYCLNGDPNYPCFILTIKGCTIMIDCSLDIKNLQHFLPIQSVQNQRYDSMQNYKLKNGNIMDYSIKEYNNRIFINSMLEFQKPQFNLVNIEDIDVVLLSNCHAMLALPYLTKLKEFRAIIYCTEPTLHSGRLLMEELVFHLKQREMSSYKWKTIHSNILAQLLCIKEYYSKPHNWCSIYSKEEVELCISKIKLVGFSEKLNIFGSLFATPINSGALIGSCNWIIECGCDKYLYLSKSSYNKIINHTKQINEIFFKQQIYDSIIITNLFQNPVKEPEQIINEMCKAIVQTLKNNGNVLIPMHMCGGRIYDLIEYIYRCLCESNLASSIPIYLISPIGNQSFAYSNIYGEYLNDIRINQVYQAESPFLHTELIKNGALKIYSSISDGKFNDEFRQPSVVLCSHPSLRFGDVCHFIELWKNLAHNSFIFVEPEFNYLDCLAPFQPIYANYYYFPVDFNLHFSEIKDLLKDCKYIQQLVISDQYRHTLVSPSSFHNELIDNELQKQFISSNIGFGKPLINYYRQNDCIKLAIKRKFEPCDIDCEMANKICFKISTSNSLAYSTITANLLTNNNRHLLKLAPKTIPLTRRDRIDDSNLRKYIYGKLNIEQFEFYLKQFGINKFTTIKKDENEYVIQIDQSNSIIANLNTNKIDIVDDNEEIRQKIKDSLVKCLNVL